MTTAVRRWLQPSWLCAPVVVLVGWLAFQQQRRLDRPWTFLVSDLVPGLLIVAAGLVIAASRPHNRCWALIVAAGFAWYVGDFEHAVDPNVALAGFAFIGWYGPLLGWALLAFPSGRLHRRRDRLLVAALCGLFTTRSLARLLLHVPPDVAGYGVRNRFLPIADDRWWRSIEDVFAWAYPAAVLLGVGSAVKRWVGSGRPSRRMLAPALIAATVLSAAVSYEYVIGWNATIPPVANVRIFYAVWWAYAAVAVSLAAGLILLRGARSAVIDVFADLADHQAPPRLGAALARALGDPSLTLLTWSPTLGEYQDGNGTAADPPDPTPDQAVTGIERQGEPMALMVHDPALLEDPGLVSAVVTAVRLTVDNDRLQAEVGAQLVEVAASRARIVAAADAERQRIERDLHDGAQQRLVTIALALRLAEARLHNEADSHAREALGQAVKDLAEAIDELRDLARGIHPAILSESGLAAALDSLVERSRLPVRLDTDLPFEPPTQIAAAVYFVVSEALTNVAKHSGATHVNVHAFAIDDSLRVEVSDDGVGGAIVGAGTGLSGIADRVATVGGQTHVHSPAGGGTRLEVELPCVLS